ncbi:hypothetical protein TPHA_0C00560 [Tetrapisispora phaffii CBS 4417]|uniref:Uncharacterized protein n=1 Tax=Tetrapisispora phaffii (strain ATCC 24235 / CBS 4417 / NBRC 1672 / NRRL Y-8282 / UCD 70-5) TaxID=1071381 RepID=G8BR37_TETPH|nr:hypothetical protein TPHA_0C00560 [Tetrapisispora phaffii CBS 4417]CCE62213.1 hypothetical protein TPHA_0C00560 [Tetrapisispora phaffii CBS 4417]
MSDALEQTSPVTPFVSELLLGRGPLQIRFINTFIAKKYPVFNEYSNSKKRRVLMQILEKGDFSKRIVFKKVGWGEWYAKQLGDVSESEFNRIRDEENKKSNSITASSHLLSPSPTAKAKKLQQKQKSVMNTLYIDENAIVSDDDEDENIMNSSEDENPYIYHHRKPSLNYDILSQKLKSSIKPNNSQIVSKKNSRTWSATATTNSNSKSIRNRRRSSNVIAYNPSATNNNRTESDVEDVAELAPNEKREARMSISKESGIRSTLLSPTPGLINFSTTTNTSVPNSIFSINSPTVSKEQISDTVPRLNERVVLTPKSGSVSGTDTDEEDWANIGAETLRNTYYTQLHSNEASPKPNNELELEIKSNGQRLKNDSDAAILLMSLKS